MTTPAEAGIVTLDGEITYVVVLDNSGRTITLGDFPHCRMHRRSDRKPRCIATCKITDRDGTTTERCTRERRHGDVHVHHRAPGQPVLAWRTAPRTTPDPSSPTQGSVMCVLCNATGHVETDITRAEGIRTAHEWALHFAQHHPNAPTPVSQHLVMVPDPAAKETR